MQPLVNKHVNGTSPCFIGRFRQNQPVSWVSEWFKKMCLNHLGYTLQWFNMTTLADSSWKITFHYKLVIFRVQLLIYQRIYPKDSDISVVVICLMYPKDVSLGCQVTLSQPQGPAVFFNATNLLRGQSPFQYIGTLWLCQNSYWKWPFIVSFPIKNCDFPLLC